MSDQPFNLAETLVRDLFKVRDDMRSLQVRVETSIEDLMGRVEDIRDTIEDSSALHHGRCATCRWWTSPETDTAANDGRLPVGWRMCEPTRFDESVSREDSGRARAIVDSGAWESVETVMATAPDFGCVQYEAKDADRVD